MYASYTHPHTLTPTQPDCDPGDLIVILQESNHPVFKRAGIDLIMEKTVSLSEALCGCEFVVKHLDGQQLLVKTRPGEVIAPGVCVRVCVCVCAPLFQSHAVPLGGSCGNVREGEREREVVVLSASAPHTEADIEKPLTLHYFPSKFSHFRPKIWKFHNSVLCRLQTLRRV